MKENFEKVKTFVHEHSLAIALTGYGLSALTLGYFLGKAAGGMTWDEMQKLMDIGARIGYDYVKDHGIEAADAAFKMIK